jgi:hypothetical protein
VIMPPGVCVINVAALVSIKFPVWLKGSGKFATVLKRQNSSNTHSYNATTFSGPGLLNINSNGVTFSDFTIDGNQGGVGIITPAAGIAARLPFSDITIRRMRFLNATDSDIVSSVDGPGNYTKNWLVEDNEFQNQANPTLSCFRYAKCGNVRLLQPLQVQVIRNRSDSSQHFALFGSTPGGGQVEVGNNIVTNLNGFGVALGGGDIGAAGAHVHHNFISTTPTDVNNMIDVAFWYDFNVDHNILHHNGVAASSVNEPTACIADFPPAFHGMVDSNRCIAVPTANLNVVGISMGGNDIGIINNFVQDCSGAGIGVAVGSQGPTHGIRIIGNTTKNNSRQTPGAHAGIELYLGDAPPNLAALSDVIIQGNHSYDDQAVKTQGYGIGIALFGVRTKFANIIVEQNDIGNNKTAPFLSNASPNPGFVIRHNFGFNPVGMVAAPAVPATGSPFVNNTGFDVNVYLTSGAQPVSLAINGVPLLGVTLPGGGSVSAPIHLPANQTITLTYTGGPPAWQWVAE